MAGPPLLEVGELLGLTARLEITHRSYFIPIGWRSLSLLMSGKECLHLVKAGAVTALAVAFLHCRCFQTIRHCHSYFELQAPMACTEPGWHMSSALHCGSLSSYRFLLLIRLLKPARFALKVPCAGRVRRTRAELAILLPMDLLMS